MAWGGSAELCNDMFFKIHVQSLDDTALCSLGPQFTNPWPRIRIYRLCLTVAAALQLTSNVLH